MSQGSPIQALEQQRLLLQLEYQTEKETFRKQTEEMGVMRKVKRGDAWWPLKVEKSYYNSLNQLAVEVIRTSDQEIEHTFEFGKTVMFFSRPYGVYHPQQRIPGHSAEHTELGGAAILRRDFLSTHDGSPRPCHQGKRSSGLST